jgi:transcription elongation factor GreA
VAYEEGDVEETLITPDGLARLTAELERLTTVAREEIAERLREALAAEANGAHTSVYQDVCDDQALLEMRIALLDERIRSARVVEPGEANGVVDVGEHVRLRDLESGERLNLELVGPWEADPFAGRVSISSPIGRALLGLRRGEIAVVDAPLGRRRLKVLAIEEARALDVA